MTRIERNSGQIPIRGRAFGLAKHGSLIWALTPIGRRVPTPSNFAVAAGPTGCHRNGQIGI